MTKLFMEIASALIDEAREIAKPSTSTHRGRGVRVLELRSDVPTYSDTDFRYYIGIGKNGHLGIKNFRLALQVLMCELNYSTGDIDEVMSNFSELAQQFPSIASGTFKPERFVEIRTSKQFKGKVAIKISPKILFRDKDELMITLTKNRPKIAEAIKCGDYDTVYTHIANGVCYQELQTILQVMSLAKDRVTYEESNEWVID